MFKPQEKAVPTFTNSDEDIQKDTPLQERPLICLIDLEENTVEALQLKGFNCTEASLGTPIHIPNIKNKEHRLCLPNQELPANLHEHDIVILDLLDCESIDYDENEHVHLGTKEPKQVYFVCEYPQTIFDPRPLVSNHLAKDIEEIQTKESIIIIFSSERESIDYHPVAILPHGFKRGEGITFDNYSWWSGVPSTQNKKGYQTSIISDFTGSTLGDILQKYNEQFFYEITFQHPTVWNQTEAVRKPDERFIPLIVNSSNEIVAFIAVEESSVLFVFPQLENKTAFLLDLLQHYLPGIKPALFPFNTKFA